MHGRHTRKGLGELTKTVKGVDVGGLAVTRNRVQVHGDTLNGLTGGLLNVVIIGPERHGVTNKVSSTGLKTKLLVNLRHGVLVKIKTLVSGNNIFLVVANKLKKGLEAALLKETHKRRLDGLSLG